jgi:hypothetical protein
MDSRISGRAAGAYPPAQMRGVETPLRQTDIGVSFSVTKLSESQ